MTNLITTPIGYIDDKPVYSLFGGDGTYGYSTAGDVLVNTLADGTDLGACWAEAIAALALYNEQRSAVASLLSHPVQTPADAVLQGSGASFEEASEYGEPVSARAPSTAALLGADFRDMDLASRMTWRFLRDADQRQVAAQLSFIMEADNRLTTGRVINRLLSPTPVLNEWNHTCYGLYTGDDGMTPPPHLGATFSSDHSHYVVSGASVLDSADLEDGWAHIEEHGYGVAGGERLIALVNPVEAKAISSFKANVESRSGGPKATTDFIPSQGAPAYLSADPIVGQVAPAEFNGLRVSGSYGPLWVCPTQFIPSGYVVIVATAGPNAERNPISFREHANLAYRGLRLIPGRDQRYPLVESFAVRSFGTGIRHRGAAVVIQVSAAGPFVAPSVPV